MGKVVSQADLILRRRESKISHERFVLASGAFDLLHPGHIRFLEQARSFGDVLVVAVYTDDAVRSRAARANEVKPKTPRPITPAAERAEIVAGLASVDYVVQCEGDSLASLIEQLSPGVIAEGSDKPEFESAAFPNGDPRAGETRVVSIALDPGYSTTAIIARIVDVGRLRLHSA